MKLEIQFAGETRFAVSNRKARPTRMLKLSDLRFLPHPPATSGQMKPVNRWVVG